MKLLLTWVPDRSALVVAEQLAPRRVPMVHTPEARLMHALLEQAAHDLAAYGNAVDAVGSRIFRQAWRWTRSADRGYPFSFVNVCETLGYCPQAVRRRLLALAENARRSP